MSGGSVYPEESWIEEAKIVRYLLDPMHFEGPLSSPDVTGPNLRTVWQIDDGTDGMSHASSPSNRSSDA